MDCGVDAAWGSDLAGAAFATVILGRSRPTGQSEMADGALELLGMTYSSEEATCSDSAAALDDIQQYVHVVFELLGQGGVLSGKQIHRVHHDQLHFVMGFFVKRPGESVCDDGTLPNRIVRIPTVVNAMSVTPRAVSFGPTFMDFLPRKPSEIYSARCRLFHWEVSPIILLSPLKSLSLKILVDT